MLISGLVKNVICLICIKCNLSLIYLVVGWNEDALIYLQFETGLKHDSGVTFHAGLKIIASFVQVSYKPIISGLYI